MERELLYLRQNNPEVQQLTFMRDRQNVGGSSHKVTQWSGRGLILPFNLLSVVTVLDAAKMVISIGI